MLNRNINFWGGVSICVSLVIGTGLFSLPTIAIDLAGPIMSYFSWLILIFYMPIFVIIFAKLGQKYPTTEGLIFIAYKALGDWSKKGIIMVAAGSYVAGMPILFFVLGSFIAELFSLHNFIFEIACILVVISAIFNFLGNRFLTIINNLLLFLILAVVFTILILSFQVVDINAIRIKASSTVFDLHKIWLGCSILFWAFLGFENTSFIFGELKNPKKMIPLVLGTSFFVIALIYLLLAGNLSLVFLSGIHIGGVTGLNEIFKIFGVEKIVIIGLVAMIIANINSWVYVYIRFSYSSSKDMPLPKFVGKLTKNGYPIGALILTSCLNVILLILIQYFKIDYKYGFQLTSQGFIILFGLAAFTYFREVKNIFSFLVFLLALVLVIFLLQGFKFLLLYSLIAFFIGVIFHFLSKIKKLNLDHT